MREKLESNGQNSVDYFSSFFVRLLGNDEDAIENIIDNLVLEHLEACNMQDTAACFRAEKTFRDVSGNGDRESKRALRALHAFDETNSTLFQDFRNDIPELLYFKIRVYFALCMRKIEIKSNIL